MSYRYGASNTVTGSIEWAGDGWIGRVDNFLHRHGLTAHRPFRFVVCAAAFGSACGALASWLIDKARSRG